jgi:hypothetical protein
MVKLTQYIKDLWLALILGIALIVLSGCATTAPEIRYAEIPQPPVIERPRLDTEDLNSSMDPGTVIQLHRSTIIKLKAWGLELEKALDAYRKKP